eukprot:SAG25_NODE_10821_length_322_cov_0.659193_2_plen_24_part_01
MCSPGAIGVPGKRYRLSAEGRRLG